MITSDKIKSNIIDTEIREKMGAIDIMYKLVSGIALISDTYAKFTSVIMNSVSSTDSESIAEADFPILCKTYVNGIELSLSKEDRPDDSIYKLLEDKYSVVSARGEFKFDQFISLDKLNKAYFDLIQDIRSLSISKPADYKDKYKVIDTDCKNIFNEIDSLKEDILIAFFKESVDDKYIFHDGSNLITKSSIRSFSDVCAKIDSTFKYLNLVYLTLVSLLHECLRLIDISNPTNYGIKDIDEDF